MIANWYLGTHRNANILYYTNAANVFISRVTHMWRM